MDDAVTELAAYFRARAPVPDDVLIRLTRAARAGGHSWASIAAVSGDAATGKTTSIKQLGRLHELRGRARFPARWDRIPGTTGTPGRRHPDPALRALGPARAGACFAL